MTDAHHPFIPKRDEAMQMIRTLLAAAILLTATPLAHAQSVDQAAANGVRFDEILANASFSPRERSAITQTYENLARSSPDTLSKIGPDVAKASKLYDRASPGLRAAIVTKIRRNLELQPCTPTQGTLCAIEIPIIRAHDPVILVDPTRKLVFTHASIVALVAGARSVAGRLNLAPPGSDAPDMIAAQLRARDAQGQTVAFDVMQDAASYNFYISGWSHAVPQAGVDKMHSFIAGQGSEADRVFFLSQAAAFAGKIGQKIDPTGAAALSTMTAMRGQIERRILNSTSPRCYGAGSGTGTNYTYCAGMN
jgi:hypothetical protein